MPYYTDKEDYTPKFAIGDVVKVRTFSGNHEGPVRIVARKVTRNRNTCDTYYTFDDGTKAYEWAIEHTTYRRTPGNWADNIASGRDFSTWVLSVENGNATLWVTGRKGDAKITAPLTPEGDIESIGRHSATFTFFDGTEGGNTYDNLGECIVDVSNRLR